MPVLKDIGVSLPTLDLHFDSKLYAQTIAGVDVAGVGPKGQIELVHDLDNDLSIVAGIAGDTAHSALDGAGKVLAALLGHGGGGAADNPADRRRPGAGASGPGRLTARERPAQGGAIRAHSGFQRQSWQK